MRSAAFACSPPRTDVDINIARVLPFPDPVANGVVGGEAALKHLTYSTVVRATILAGQLHVAVGADDSVVGTACWYPPGTDFLAEYVVAHRAPLSVTRCR